METDLRIEQQQQQQQQIAEKPKSTKEELITNIKEWIKIDNDIAKFPVEAQPTDLYFNDKASLIIEKLSLSL